MAKPYQNQSWPYRPPLNFYSHQVYSYQYNHPGAPVCQQSCCQQPRLPRGYMPSYGGGMAYNSPPSSSYHRPTPHGGHRFPPVNPYMSQGNQIIHRPIPQSSYELNDYYRLNNQLMMNKPPNVNYARDSNYPSTSGVASTSSYETTRTNNTLDVRQFLSTWQEKDDDTQETAASSETPYNAEVYQPLDCTKRPDIIPFEPPQARDVPYAYPGPSRLPSDALGESSSKPLEQVKDTSFVPFERRIEKISNPTLIKQPVMPKVLNDCSLNNSLYQNAVTEFKNGERSQYYLNASLESGDLFDDINRKKDEKQKNVVHPLQHEDTYQFSSGSNMEFSSVAKTSAPVPVPPARPFDIPPNYQVGEAFLKEKPQCLEFEQYIVPTSSSTVPIPTANFDNTQTFEQSMSQEEFERVETNQEGHQEMEISSEDIDISIGSPGDEFISDSNLGCMEDDLLPKEPSQSENEMSQAKTVNLVNSAELNLPQHSVSINKPNVKEIPNNLENIALQYIVSDDSVESAKVKNEKKVTKNKVKNCTSKTSHSRWITKTRLWNKIKSKSKLKLKSKKFKTKKKYLSNNKLKREEKSIENNTESVVASTEIEIDEKNEIEECQNCNGEVETLISSEAPKNQIFERVIMEEREENDYVMRVVGSPAKKDDLSVARVRDIAETDKTVETNMPVNSWPYREEVVVSASERGSIKCSLAWNKIFNSFFGDNQTQHCESLDLGPAKMHLTLSPNSNTEAWKVTGKHIPKVFSSVMNVKNLILKRNSDTEVRVPKMVIRKSGAHGYTSYIKDVQIPKSNGKAVPFIDSGNNSSAEGGEINQDFNKTESTEKGCEDGKKCIDHIHHCLLCHISYKSFRALKNHEESVAHKQLEIIQKNAYHKLYNAIYGRDCPKVKSLTEDELSYLNWKPKSENGKDFYHNTPL